MPGSPAHLFRRFFDVAVARPLSESERSAVDGWLIPETTTVFFAQGDADQRHGYQAALTVVSAGVDDRDVIAAALLHDIGKRHARLGILGRTLASLMILLRMPLGERMAAYRDHGLLGARELARVGAPPLAIDFAMHHHGARPPSIPSEIWDLLERADQPPKATSSLVSRITSNGR